MNDLATLSFHTEVRDGVRVFWTPEAPEPMGTLMFRVGISDETIVTRGITHLAEHLALYPLGHDQRFAFNGFVDGMRTVFHATGTQEQLADFFSQLVAGIAAPPLDRIDAEARVLRTEASRRGAGPADAALWQRYGSRGHGLPLCPEWLLDAPSRTSLAAWMAERFTAENAVAWFAGPIPDGLSFAGLPRGRRFDAPATEPLEDLPLPATAAERPGGIALSVVAPRERWIAVPLGIAARRVIERLRFREALAYDMILDTRLVGGHHMHVTFAMPCLDEHMNTAIAGLMEVLEKFADEGATTEELQRTCEETAEEWAKPPAVFSHLDQRAVNELVGYPSRDAAQLLEEMRAMTPAGTAAAVREALGTALLLVPGQVQVKHDHFTPAPSFSRAAVTGRHYRSAAERFPWSRKRVTLVVGHDGVSLVLPDGRARTVWFERCGARVDPEGRVELMGDDGFNFNVSADEWRGGPDAVMKILAGLPREATVHVPRR